jgi:CDGSH-type Zn-finger protein
MKMPYITQKEMVTKGKQVNICRCGQSPTTPAKTDFK